MGKKKPVRSVRKDGGVVGGDGGKVVQRLVDSGGEAGRRHVVAKNPLVGDLSEEARLRGHLLKQMRDVLLPFGREGLLVAGASAEGDDDDLALLRDGRSAGQRACGQKRGSQGQPGGIAQELPPCAAEQPC